MVAQISTLFSAPPMRPKDYPQVPPELVINRNKLRQELEADGAGQLEVYKDKVKACWQRRMGFTMIGINHIHDELRLAMIGKVKPTEFVDRLARALCIERQQ